MTAAKDFGVLPERLLVACALSDSPALGVEQRELRTGHRILSYAASRVDTPRTRQVVLCPLRIALDASRFPHGGRAEAGLGVTLRTALRQLGQLFHVDRYANRG